MIGGTFSCLLLGTVVCGLGFAVAARESGLVASGLADLVCLSNSSGLADLIGLSGCGCEVTGLDR